MSGKWREQARCREIGYPFTIFYSSNNEETNIAKAICSMCPVAKACLDYAIMTKEPDGVWGGLDHKQRKKLIKSLSLRKQSFNDNNEVS